LRLRLFVLCVLSLGAVVAAFAAGQSSAAVVCSGDYCVIDTPFDALRADISANAPPRLAQLFTAEANRAQAFHPPGPCMPSSCVASQRILIALDIQVQAMSEQCRSGERAFTAANAFVLDGDIRGILSDTAIYAFEFQLLPPGPPAIPPGPPCIPPGPPSK
jgi:hypothetical protein